MWLESSGRSLASRVPLLPIHSEATPAVTNPRVQKSVHPTIRPYVGILHTASAWSSHRQAKPHVDVPSVPCPHQSPVRRPIHPAVNFTNLGQVAACGAPRYDHTGNLAQAGCDWSTERADTTYCACTIFGLAKGYTAMVGSLTAGRANLVTATHDVAGQDLDPVTSAQTQRQDVGQRRQCVARAVVVRWVEVVVVGGGSTPPATVRV